MFTSLILSFSFCQSGPGYQFPEQDLFRNNGINSNTVLERSDTLRLWYTWHDVSYLVNILGQKRQSASDPWREFHENESVTYRMTAAAPYYASNSMYIAGVDDVGVTIIEKWTPQFLFVAGGVGVTVQKSVVMTDAGLTHLRALAVDPNETFLLAQHHETGDIVRIDLTNTPPTYTISVSAVAWPVLAQYDIIKWQRHVTQGDVFIMTKGRTLTRHLVNESDLDGLLIWDADLNGFPENVEQLEWSDWVARGYDNAQNWIDPVNWQP